MRDAFSTQPRLQHKPLLRASPLIVILSLSLSLSLPLSRSLSLSDWLFTGKALQRRIKISREAEKGIDGEREREHIEVGEHP